MSNVLRIACLITAASCFAADAVAQEKVRVFILAGQSNMQGLGQADWGRDYLGDDVDGNPTFGASYIGGPGSLRYFAQTADPAKYGKLLDTNGDWIVRDDVWVWSRNGQDLPGIDDDSDKNNDTVTGNLTTGFGAVPNNGNSQIGPEFGFGQAVGDAFDDQVAIVKIAWGGKSLGYDFRPPTAQQDRPIDWANYGRNGLDPEGAGAYYDLTVSNIQDALVDLAEQFPDKEIELTGFGWHQGFNDRLNEGFRLEYEENMTDFINDMREDLAAADLPFVIATTGMNPLYREQRNLQLHVEQTNLADPELHPEFEGNVDVVDTRGFWREQELSPSADGAHWNQNGESYYLIGESMGEAMVALVPEPSSLAIFALGGLALTRRDHRNRSN